ncbi:MAG: hypothetical protein WC142_09885 [Bacteroidales bacterium]
MKKFTLILTAMISCQMVFGQLKVVQNGDVGIGTNNPLHKLQVNGTTYLNGNVGIGITYPQYQLHINGEFCMQYGSYSPLRISLGNYGPGIGSNADRMQIELICGRILPDSIKSMPKVMKKFQIVQ